MADLEEYELLLPTVTHDGGGVMIWARFAAKGPGRIAVTMNSSLYQSIME